MLEHRSPDLELWIQDLDASAFVWQYGSLRKGLTGLPYILISSRWRRHGRLEVKDTVRRLNILIKCLVRHARIGSGAASFFREREKAS